MKGSGLYNLIKTAERTSIRGTRILPPNLAEKALRIKEVGDSAVHEAACSESKALEAIRNTAEVFTRLYGSTSKGVR